MTPKTPPLLLIDGSSYFYRAFHALPPLSNSKGNPTGAVYGVLNMIRRLIKDYPQSTIAVIFDTKGKTFRDELYPDYKANREAMPDELTQQFVPLITVIEAMGLPLIMVEGVEADDVIGTYAHHATQAKRDVIISTGDKDMAQLVTKHITCINTMNNYLMDRAGVIEKFGVPPELIVDYLALIGDKSDNIPGVPKVGPKTAVKWLEEYGSLDAIMANASNITGKVGEYLRESLLHLPLSKTLVTIKTDCTLPLSLEQLQSKPADTARLIALFKELEFKTWLNELLTTQPEEKSPFEIILTESQLHKLVTKLQETTLFAVDTETTDLDYMKAELVGLSFAAPNIVPCYIPVAHDYEYAPKQLSREIVLRTLQPLLEDPAHHKIGQNIKYDMSILANYGITLRGAQYDTMLESYTLNSSGARHDMDSLALKYLGKNTIHFEDIAGKGAKQKTFNQIAIGTAAEYAAEDADITWQLHQHLWPMVAEHSSVAHAFASIEMPLIPVLSRMERTGVLINEAALKRQSEDLAVRIASLTQQAYEMVGQEFNLSSPKQLQVILYEKMQIPVTQKTATGQPSTAEDVLQELADDYALPKLILEYRSYTKLKSTYIDALPLQVNPRTGRVHTSYNQAVASTGRLSSTDPNLQNIPIRSEQGRLIRQAFIAPPGHKIVSADYSQIELRIMSHLSQDPGLTNAFKNGHDIHAATAAEVFNVALENVTPDQRRHAKAINFGLIYGMSAFGLAKQINASREEAQRYIDKYFARYPGVKAYLDNTRMLAHKQGYVETHFGRRIHLAEINASNFQRQKAAERAAINAPLQGTAADIIKLAMIALDDWLQTSKFPARMIMQVHDELVFEVADDALVELKPILHEKMCHVKDMSVNLEIAIGVGNNWDEAH